MFTDNGCGAVILSTGARIRTPFVIKAIGNPNVLSKALNTPRGVTEPLRKLGMITTVESSRVAVPAYVPRLR